MSEPIRETLVVYRCPHCRRARTKKTATAAHMPHCFKNPERVPRVGELSRDLYEGQSEPAWWDGPGKIWDGSTWVEVLGYDDRDGTWPVYDGKPLDEWPLPGRLSYIPGAS